jgi:hypothetical protein
MGIPDISLAEKGFDVTIQLLDSSLSRLSVDEGG